MFDFLKNKIVFHQHLYISTTTIYMYLFIKYLKIAKCIDQKTLLATSSLPGTKVGNPQILGITKFKVYFI